MSGPAVTGGPGALTQHDFWNAYAGPGWAEHADALEAIGDPAGRPALAAARLRPGMRVLDVGCGTGGSTMAIAEAVGPTGHAIGVDLSAPMIAAARDRAAARGLGQVEFVTVGIEDYATAEPVDVAYSRMCLMLLERPVRGCAAIRDALRPGGRLCATVFRDLASNPWLAAVVLGAAPHVGPMPPLPMPGEPGPFAFEEASTIRAVLAAAGFADIEVEPVDTLSRPEGTVEAVADLLISLGPAGGAYRNCAPAARRAARLGAASLLRRYEDDAGRLALPGGSWLITAVRPR